MLFKFQNLVSILHTSQFGLVAAISNKAILDLILLAFHGRNNSAFCICGPCVLYLLLLPSLSSCCKADAKI